MQLKSLIRNISDKNNVTPQSVLNMFLLENFLECISSSGYNRFFILKGGLLISNLFGISNRTTMDMDLTLTKYPSEEKALEKLSNDICNKPFNDVKYEFVSMDKIMEISEYNCYRIHINAYFGTIKNKMYIDLSTGDNIEPKEKLFRYTNVLKTNSFCILSYNLENILSEKIESILSKGKINTRMKDFYDVYQFDHLLFDQINMKYLKEAIFHTLKERETEEYLNDYETILDSLKMYLPINDR